jgi:TonB-dependent SusC/RagA subfamily outer membrane receptor
MNQLVYYILQVIAASAMLYGYYHLALRNKKFHRYNRFYLLAVVLISILIPFLNIPVYFSEIETKSSFVLQTLVVISSSAAEPAVLPVTADQIVYTHWFTLSIILWSVYILIVLIKFLKIIFSLKKLRTIVKNNPVEKLQQINFVTTDEPGTPFSFFRWLFWNRRIGLRSEKGEQIFRHELFHIQQRHSLDIISMELLTGIFWFNPFFYLMKKELKAIHEFLADEFAIHENEKWPYAELLLMQALNTKNHLVNPFFHNQIKRRIAMITSPSKPGHQYLQKLLVLPVATLVAALFAFNYKEKVNEKSQLKIPVQRNINNVQDTIKPGLQRLDSTFTPSVIIKNQDTGRLLVIDGIIKGPFTDFKKIDQWIKPEDILSINVLNGTTATKLYGDVGKNVVIEITTKKKPDRAAVNIITGEIRIHTENEKPLIVLDNKELPGLTMEQLNALIDPDDIQNVNVLKGTSATALYGENGKNGVIEIRTKKKSKSAAFNIITGEIRIHTENEKPLIVLDNKELPGLTMEQLNALIDPDDIQNVNVLKGTSATVLYGENGKNGVIEIRTKKKPNSATAKINVGEKPDYSTYKNYLLVIDGVLMYEMNPVQLDSLIQPADIQHINILKGPAASVLYGNKGKNGVIEIYTKKNPEGVSAKKVTLTEIKPKNGKENKVSEKLDVPPSFPGGDTEWRKFLEKNIDATVPVKYGAPAGSYKVELQFIVNIDGSISDLKALSNKGYGMEEECLRMMKLSPNWLPATETGKKVAAYKKQPITFVVAEE